MQTPLESGWESLIEATQQSILDWETEIAWQKGFIKRRKGDPRWRQSVDSAENIIMRGSELLAAERDALEKLRGKHFLALSKKKKQLYEAR
jgi:hypothetical protein